MTMTNPFVELAGSIDPVSMQIYVVAMIALVVLGTLIDVIHKKSAKYFFEVGAKAAKNATRNVGGGEKIGTAISTVTSEVLTSSEFCSVKRRISHLFTMYGFIIFVVASAMLIFAYPTNPEAGIWPALWHIGAGMLCFGGYWFWFFIRVDVSAEGKRWYQLCRADIFILGLLSTATFALAWSGTQGDTLGWLFFGLFVASATLLFSTVLWSKFAHMFFKPAAAYQKKITKVDGSRENLPADVDLTDPAIQAKFPDIPEYMGTNPEYMGLGIKREAPKHY